MKLRRLRALCALLALLLALGALASCMGIPPTNPSTNPSTDPPTAEELLSRVEASRGVETGCETVNEWLLYWEFPAYDTATLSWMEKYYRTYYIEKDEMDAPDAVAVRVAEFFCENMDLIDPSDKGRVTDLIAECYLAAVGDRYANYMNAADFEEYLSDQGGSFVGIGVRMVYDNETKKHEIVSVMRDTPAMEAGLLAGDIMVAVNGIELDTLSYYESTKLFRGAEGSEITVTVLRDGERLDFTMRRRALEQVTVESRMLDGNIGYIRIEEFDETTFEQFTQELEKVLSLGAKGLVFDVRSNPGGTLTAILAVLDYLVKDGVPIASYAYYDGSKDISTASDGHRLADGIPIAVLANQYTASAGELFTAALKDYDEKGYLDVTVIGVTTYGKGTMQGLFRLPDGRATTVSIAYYNPPYSENYEGVGVIPHILSELSAEAEKKSLYQLTPEEDTQLADALASLAARLDG